MKFMSPSRSFPSKGFPPHSEEDRMTSWATYGPDPTGLLDVMSPLFPFALPAQPPCGPTDSGLLQPEIIEVGIYSACSF